MAERERRRSTAARRPGNEPPTPRATAETSGGTRPHSRRQRSAHPAQGPAPAQLQRPIAHESPEVEDVVARATQGLIQFRADKAEPQPVAWRYGWWGIWGLIAGLTIVSLVLVLRQLM